MSSTLTESFRAVALALPEGSTLPVPRDWLLEVLGSNAAPLQSEPAAAYAPTSAAPLLTIAQAAERLALAPSYLYRHASSLPFIVRTGGRTLRVDATKMDRWIARRTAT